MKSFRLKTESKAFIKHVAKLTEKKLYLHLSLFCETKSVDYICKRALYFLMDQSIIEKHHMDNGHGHIDLYQRSNCYGFILID